MEYGVRSTEYGVRSTTVPLETCTDYRYRYSVRSIRYEHDDGRERFWCFLKPSLTLVVFMRLIMSLDFIRTSSTKYGVYSTECTVGTPYGVLSIGVIISQVSYKQNKTNSRNLASAPIKDICTEYSVGTPYLYNLTIVSGDGGWLASWVGVVVEGPGQARQRVQISRDPEMLILAPDARHLRVLLSQIQRS
jgi:hypothetical protein